MVNGGIISDTSFAIMTPSKRAVAKEADHHVQTRRLLYQRLLHRISARRRQDEFSHPRRIYRLCSGIAFGVRRAEDAQDHLHFEDQQARMAWNSLHGGEISHCACGRLQLAAASAQEILRIGDDADSRELGLNPKTSFEQFSNDVFG